jgi:hypothetical protein
MTQEMQSIGGIAATIVNRWAWWQNALKGEFGPIHHEPEQGYFRVRRKGEPWEPVAIWVDEDGRWLAYRSGKEVEADAIWTWACRNPITHEAYEKAMAGGGFDDEPRAAPGIGDNSGDADPFDALMIELAGEIETATGFMKTEVKTQADADKAGIWAKRLTELAKRADNLRVVEKEPHLVASRAVDDKWRDPIASAKDWATKLKRHVEGFLIAQKRAEEERQRKAREEADAAQRAATEAARKARESNQQSTQEQEAAARKADRLANQAKQAEQEAEARRVNAGRTGARVSVRVEKVAVVTDYGKAAAALVALNHKDLIETIDKLAQRAAKAGMPFDGMEIKEVEKVV